MTEKKKSNRLINESSPYLLQHAHNPVDWYPWSDEALEKASHEDKPILVSIGYSACHWCHVMERESFENQQIADFLNNHFISIKVDREEKPDVDQIYMDAVQAMGQQGGWPLNVFLTPEQKPFFGGTYFPAQAFYQILVNVRNAFTSNREKLDLSAEQLANHLSKSEISRYGLTSQDLEFEKVELANAFQQLSQNYDHDFGGFNKAPKFPMPSIWKLLLRHVHFSKEENEHMIFTLKQMARGGIYDQIGGGFARYSVDEKWFVPHFEKMLYDNGQLLSLYAEAYMISGEEEFAHVIRETVNFLSSELTNDQGGFFSALDADSEGVEGKYYVWKAAEFRKTLGNDGELWADFFGVTDDGNWEDGLNILYRRKSIESVAEKLNCSTKEAKVALAHVKEKLMKVRAKRIKPGLDDKILAGWNGLALSGLIDAYNALDEDNFLALALENARYLFNEHIRERQVFRTPGAYSRTIPGYLEDYAFVIQAFIKLYQVTYDESWLFKARELMNYGIESFYDEKEGFFFYSDKNTRPLIATKKEIFDNVIPSSNAIMAENMYMLGLLFDEESYNEKAEQMVLGMNRLIMTDLEYTSYWGLVLLMMQHPMAEIAIIGKDIDTLRKKINKIYYPNKIICGTETSSDLPLLRERRNLKSNTIYVCYDKTCKLPVHTAQEALKLLV
jgi:uncharacterized protein YyaL (SSP411 family)